MARTVNFINHRREVALLRQESFPAVFLPSAIAKIMTAVNTGKADNTRREGQYEEEISRLKNALHCVEVYQLIASHNASQRSRWKDRNFYFRFPISNVPLHRSSVNLIMRIALVVNIYYKNISFILL